MCLCIKYIGKYHLEYVIVLSIIWITWMMAVSYLELKTE